MPAEYRIPVPFYRRPSMLMVLGGLAVTICLGIAARMILQARGIDVVDWSRGIQLFVPFAIWAMVPYVILGWLAPKAAHRLIDRPMTTPAVFGKAVSDRIEGRQALGPADRVPVLVGGFLGFALMHAWRVLGLLTYSGPGGFAEAVIMVIVMSPLTVPLLTLWCALGALGGAWLAVFFSRRLSGQ